MTVNMRPYPEYKDSGLPWLGRVPAHWGIRRVRHCGRIVGGGTPSMKRSEFWGGRIPWVSPKDMKVSEIADSRDHITESALRESNISLLDPPAVLIVVRGMILARRVPIAITRVPVTINQDMKALLPLDGIDARYLMYALATAKDALAEMIDEAGHGTKRLPTVRWRQLDVWMPPPDEQKAIADYLDANAVKVRRFIRNRRRLIEVLNEQKQAIINRAVTRGLDPNAPLKPSGIDWLGDIPEHWEATTLGRLVRTFKTGPFGSILHQSDYIPGGVPLVNPVHMSGGRINADVNCAVDDATYQRLREYALRQDDIVFSRRGELGRCALVREEETGWLIGTGSIRARLIPGAADPTYLIVALQGQWVSDYLSLMSVGATMQSLNTGILSRLPLPLPPKEEQEQIPIFIERESHRVEEAIGKAKREIDLIREYRTRLIADVVTGKVDVRGLAPVEAPSDDEQIDEGIDDDEMLGDDEPELVEEIADADD